MKSPRSLRIVFLAGLLLIGGCGRNESDGEGPGELVTDIQTVTEASDRVSLVGRLVEMTAPVLSVVGNYVFWAGSADGAVPVIRLDKLRGEVEDTVKAGDTIRISGSVGLLEAVSATDPLWDRIDDAERRDILAARVYLAAERVRIVR